MAQTVLPASSATPSATAAGPNYWFSFGDSYSATGFDPSGTLPDSKNPLGNPPGHGDTIAPGPTWVGWVTTEYKKSLLYTYNYACSGATIDPSLVAPPDSKPKIRCLINQVDQFLEGAGKKPPATPWTSQNSLFSVWIGVNDINNSFDGEGDRTAVSDDLLNRYFARIEKIYAVGGRNFLFANVPPIHRSPYVRTFKGKDQTKGKDWAKEKVIIIIDDFNKKLVQRVATFAAAHPDVKTFFWDSYATFTKILDNPTGYDFKDVTNPGRGEDIFWNDVLHPGVHVHRLCAEEVSRVVLKDTIW